MDAEALLLARRDELLRAIGVSGDELAGIRVARSDGTADDEHDPEGSTLSSDWSRITSLHSTALAGLDEVDRALERLRDGTYGVCVSCGARIPDARLEVRPWADRCVACAV
ncbi:DnaK suppressor protein [Microbacteriaceae bacterium SG_E_30_P1]|uniref:DnaK suppressor protein n=1 Tax=Antiquaquibacter oligotrophicus TaxID=2880260 RepID=A0ABT6KRK4_9MICO|nr:TraR/DksA family transcriptional regulator [Antiquaquibacter oligotrophicus]MDH6182613.1 DnaK suppressor protein [Antiquaquibacter oligotrophicus]UDF14422.1 TraR/DksA C4-type zinc finger protein [Antiquaquibacter oligotrophicus]